MTDISINSINLRFKGFDSNQAKNISQNFKNILIEHLGDIEGQILHFKIKKTRSLNLGTILSDPKVSYYDLSERISRIISSSIKKNILIKKEVTSKLHH